MTCDDWRLLISLASDGRLEPHRRADLHSHLATCSACVDFSDRVARGRSVLRSLPEPDPGEEFTRSVVEAASKPAPAFRRRVFAAAGLAAALLLAGVGWLFLRPASPPTPEAAWRDRLWMLLAQVARDVRPTALEDLAFLKQELHDSGLKSGSVPDETGLLRHLEVVSNARDAESLRRQIEVSGILAAWRPTGLPPVRSIPREETKDPFRRARRALYDGRTEDALNDLGAALKSGEDEERHDDELHWMAFLYARSGHVPEAIGAYLSLSSAATPWFDAAARREAQDLAVKAAALHGGGPYRVSLWMENDPRREGSWLIVSNYAPGQAWTSFEVAGGNKGGKDAPVEIRIDGVDYLAANPAEFRARHPGAVRFLATRMPDVLSFFDEGVTEFQIETPFPPPKGP